MEKRWQIKPAGHDAVQALQQSLGINSTLCQLLVQRNIQTFQEARYFFRPELSHLHDPWQMKNMDKAVGRIIHALRQREKLLIYGDYDVDGTTSVAVVYDFLESLTEHIDYYIPNRYREGYGISKAGIDYAADNNITLIVALDCGIKSIKLVDYAKEKGIDFIICDHHLPDEQLPDAVAILNPKQKDCLYPFKELSGCGLGFKLISAIAEKLALPQKKVLQYLDLVATSIAADIVPITDENRVIAFYGLKKINENPCPGIQALIRLSVLKKKLTISNVVFMIAPRVNAAGRMDDAKKAVQLFLSKSEKEAEYYAKMLHADNSDRKETDTNITAEALAIIEKDDVLIKRKTTVLYQPHWHKGVVGIVAARLIEKYYRPTIVLTQSNEKVAGSARSVNGFNLYEAIHQCKDLLENYGGHSHAAGMTLLPENVAAFQELFEEIVAESINPELLIPQIDIDAELNFAEINPRFYNIVRQFAPFGPGNLCPLFITRAVSDTGYSRILKEEHLRLVVRQDDITFSGIAFCMADKWDIVSSGKPFDICYELEENEWNGNINLQLKVKDIRYAE